MVNLVVIGAKFVELWWLEMGWLSIWDAGKL